MPKWYDFVAALGGPVGLGVDLGIQKYAGAINEQKQGDLTAAAQSRQLGQNLYTQAMQGLGKAENYYRPASAMLANVYGSPGTMTGGPSAYPLAMPTK